jgi:hypothetical protein
MIALKPNASASGIFLGETPQDDPVKMTLCWHEEQWLPGGPTPEGEPSTVWMRLQADRSEYHGSCPTCGRRLWAKAVLSIVR